MDTAEIAERGAELVEKIEAELGTDWMERDGIAGTEKSIVAWDDDTVALASRDWAFYLVDGELWNRLRSEGSVVTGRWCKGEFEPTAVTDAPDPSRN